MACPAASSTTARAAFCGDWKNAPINRRSAGAAQAGAIGRKSRVTAALLAFFLGAFGVHKFYLGRIGWGIAYLLFFWTLIPGIVAFIEFIIYLTMTDEAFAEKYG